MFVRRLFVAGVALALFLTAGFAQEPKSKQEPKNPAVNPIDRSARHNQILKWVAKGDADVIFVGDSITQGWDGAKKTWDEAFGAYKPINMGISGDQTGHVIWRITEGKELDPIKPKLAVLMIGTNNMAGHTPEQIAGGVKAILAEFQKQKPDMKVLVLGIFPRSAKAEDAVRKKVSDTNKILATFADGKKVFYKDIGEKFLEKDGSLDKKIMPDFLHLSAEGYKIWADATKEDVARLVK